MDWIHLFLWVLTFLVYCTSVMGKTWNNATVERPVLVGAFNVQNLGLSKMSNRTVMDIVKKVILRFDLILIQEIVTTDESLMEGLLKDLNKLHRQKGSKFVMQISERLGRSTAKEQYAFIYRDDKFTFLKGHSYPDKNDDFMRPPYIAHFATPTLRDLDSMVAIGIHTQPKNAANETSALAKVYDYAKKTFKTKDAIIMGDMNAGCANVRISDWDSIELWRRKDFTWLINHDLDTTLSVNCCPYDRIVIAGESMEDAVIWDSVNAFKYRDLYGISTELALAVSDHWPVEVKLRGGSSEQASDNIKPSICLTVEDLRTKDLPSQLRSQKSTLGFQITSTESLTELYAESANSTALYQSLQSLQAKYPQFISREATETILYKVEHGVLKDPSSHDDLQSDLYSVTVSYDVNDKMTTAHFCGPTTIN